MKMLRKRCKTVGCPNLHHNKSGYCDECTKEYRRKHPDVARPSASRRGYDSAWRKFSKDYLSLHSVCSICGSPATCVDHKDIPASVMLDMNGGKFDYDPSHYQALCTSCNIRKGHKTDKAAKKRYEEDKSVLCAMTGDARGEGLKLFPESETRVVGTDPHTGKCRQ